MSPSSSLKSRHSLRPFVGRLLAATMAMSAATSSGYSRRDFPNTLLGTVTLLQDDGIILVGFRLFKVARRRKGAHGAA